MPPGRNHRALLVRVRDLGQCPRVNRAPVARVQATPALMRLWLGVAVSVLLGAQQPLQGGLAVTDDAIKRAEAVQISEKAHRES